MLQTKHNTVYIFFCIRHSDTDNTNSALHFTPDKFFYQFWVLVSYMSATQILHIHIPLIDESVNIKNIVLQVYWKQRKVCPVQQFSLLSSILLMLSSEFVMYILIPCLELRLDCITLHYITLGKEICLCRIHMAPTNKRRKYVCTNTCQQQHFGHLKLINYYKQ